MPGDEKLHDLLAVRRIKARDLAELDVFDPDPRHVAIPARAQMFQLIDLFLEFAISLPDTHLPARQARTSHVCRRLAIQAALTAVRRLRKVARIALRSSPFRSSASPPPGMRVKLMVNSWSGGLRSADAHEKANE